MKTIGTDMSLDVCKQEGYLMVKFDNSKEFDRSENYNVFAYMPAYATEGTKPEKIVDTFVSFDELAITYLRNRERINSFADTDSNVDFNSPTIYDLLNLASDINAYQGL